MKRKNYIQPAIEILLIESQQFNLPSSPGGFPGISEIKGNAFDEEDTLEEFEAAIGDLMP